MPKSRKSRKRSNTPEWIRQQKVQVAKQKAADISLAKILSELEDEYEPCIEQFPSGITVDINDKTLMLPSLSTELPMSKNTLIAALKHYLSIHNFGWVSYDYAFPITSTWIPDEMKNQTWPLDMVIAWAYPEMHEIIQNFVYEISHKPQHVGEMLRRWAHVIAVCGKMMQRITEIRLGLPYNSIKRFPMGEFDTALADTLHHLAFGLSGWDPDATPDNLFSEYPQDNTIYEYCDSP